MDVRTHLSKFSINSNYTRLPEHIDGTQQLLRPVNPQTFPSSRRWTRRWSNTEITRPDNIQVFWFFQRQTVAQHYSYTNLSSAVLDVRDTPLGLEAPRLLTLLHSRLPESM